MDAQKPVPFQKILNLDRLETAYMYSPPAGFCGCVDCVSQYRTTETQLNPATVYANAFSKIEAEHITTTYAAGIQADLQFLRRKLHTHGNTIVNRWKKKSREKRAAALIAAYPNLYPHNWAPARISHDHPLVTWRDIPELHEAQLLPFLSLEMLRDDPMRFLALLNCRTKYDPQDWVSFDLHQTRAIWWIGRLRVEFAECGVILHGPNYGKTVPWNIEQGHKWDIAGFPRAKLILEAQKILMHFLRNVVETILDGVEGEGSSEKWIALANSNFRKSSGSEAWSLYSNQAFSSPVFDVNRLVEISKARLSEAEDHLWLLQTDPAYFQSTVKTVCEGRMFNARDIRSWNQVLASKISLDPLVNIWQWRWVATEIEHLQVQYLKFRGNIHIGERLPPKVDFALGSLEILLINFLYGATQALDKALPRMASFENYYVFDYPKQGEIGYTLKSAGPSGTGSERFSKDPLFWCLRELTGDPEDPTIRDPAMLFGYLDEWLDSDTTSAKDRGRLQGRLLSELSDLAAFNELLALVRQHRPMCKCLNAAEVRRKCSDRHAWRRFGKDPVKESIDDYQDMEKHLENLQSLSFPKGKRDGVWLQRADEVRGHLKAFWDEARKLQRRRLDQEKLTEYDKRYELETLMLDTTPEHLAALKAERDVILAPKASPPKYDTTVTEWPTDVREQIFLPSRPKEKIKSRPNESQSSCAQEPDIEEEEAEFQAAVDTIRVKKESLRVLTRMFPVTPEEYAAKPLDWKSFVSAMEDAGFPATQSGGSAVTFAREGEGRIVFHRPHPVAKVEQGMLQAWGKRMKKWFHWEREIFEC